MTPIDALFLAALACGGVAALKGSRTAWVLFVATAFLSGLTLSGVPFNPALWTLVVLAASIAIALLASRRIKGRDILVLALFIPAIPCYFIDEPWTVDATTLIASLQFLALFPLVQIWNEARGRWPLVSRNSDLEMVAHA